MSSNDLMLLSDSLDKIRQLTNDTKLNEKLQDKKYLEIGQDMAAVARYANTVGGIMFGLYMAGRPVDKVIDTKFTENAVIDDTTDNKNES